MDEMLVGKKRQEINSASFPPPPAPLCVYLCNVFLPSSVDPYYQTVYHYELNALGGAFIIRLGFITPDRKTTTLSFLHPLLWVCIFPLCKCSALYVKHIYIILEPLLFPPAVNSCNKLTGSTRCVS